MAENSKITLKSCDDKTFEVEEVVAFESQTIRNFIEDFGRDVVIPLRIVSSKILSKVIDYCKYQVYSSPNEIEALNAGFLDVDQETLFALINAANYLDIKSLSDLTSQAAGV